jgi:hypothetical protein
MNKLGIGWDVISLCNFSGLILMIAGVGIVGQYAVQKYTRGVRGLDGKPELLPEGRPKLALIVFSCGIGLQVLTVVLANMVPGRP